MTEETPLYLPEQAVCPKCLRIKRGDPETEAFLKARGFEKRGAPECKCPPVGGWVATGGERRGA